MAFSNTIEHRNFAGNKRVHDGHWDATDVTGGDIDTGLMRCELLMLSHKGDAVEAAAAVVNETLPDSGNEVTIVCTSGDAGYWIAIGI